MAPKFGKLVYILVIFFGIVVLVSYWHNDFDASGAFKNIGLREPAVRKQTKTEIGNIPRFRRTFEDFAKYPAQNIKEESGNVFATFYCTKVEDSREASFVATQSLIWRMLWTEWHSKYPFVVFVCPSVSKRQRSILQGQGAIVKELPVLHGLESAAKLPTELLDQYSILNMWSETQYKKIGFLSLASFPLQKIDDIFDLVHEQNCITERLSSVDSKEMAQADKDSAARFCSYTMGGVDPFGNGGLNGGVFVLSPNQLLHQKLLRDARRTDRYEVERGVQGLLESRVTFHADGPFPAFHLPMTYNAVGDFYLQNRLETGEKAIRVVQEKMWDPIAVKDRKELSERWDTEWMGMCRWYDGHHFPLTRESGILKSKLDVYLEDNSPKVI